ncbi:putative drug exporter of the RND superfamily [Ruaniaceae bacterium KH17]|nr:putative drug exporter of the RND superfamily [Ruaniaceae bacterium KH17]
MSKPSNPRVASAASTEPEGRGYPPKWLRILIPSFLILAWLAGAAIGGPYFGRVSEVSANDQSSYLPSSSEAARVQELQGEFSDSEGIPAIVVFVADDELGADRSESIQGAVAGLADLDGVIGVSPLIPSEDGLALQLIVLIDADGEIAETVNAVSDELAGETPTGVESFVTGPAGFTADLVAAFAGIDGILLAVALVAVFIILIVVYRSILLPIAVLATSMFALTVSLLAVWWLAKAEILLLSGQTQGILFILVIGAATDYSLLYVARYREELRKERVKWVATHRALKASVEPILASGGTVIVGLMCLLLSDLKSNSTLGPVASIGIVFAMLSALTLLPSILFLFGRVAFWPRLPKYEPEVVAAEGGMPSKGPWVWLGTKIRRRPRAIWLATTALLVVGAAGMAQFEAEGVPQSELVIGASEARDGQHALAAHFPGGSGSPVLVTAPEAELQEIADALRANEGIDGVSVVSAGSPSGEAPVTEGGIAAVGPPGTEPPVPTVVDGLVLLRATLVAEPDSAAAQQTVRDLRTEFADADGVLVGGATATAIDTNDASIRDRNTIVPIALAVILVILMLLLRSVLAPVLLVATTALSFVAALGVSSLIFSGIFQFPGVDPAVPLYSFVFLVALGIDYNIFLATRVREETKLHGTREGIVRGLSVTGGVITSAGLVLAATFAALAVIPILFLVQIAFIVAFGVLIDTFIVRALLVPALMYEIGPRVWWPSRLQHREETLA